MKRAILVSWPKLPLQNGVVIIIIKWTLIDVQTRFLSHGYLPVSSFPKGWRVAGFRTVLWMMNRFLTRRKVHQFCDQNIKIKEANDRPLRVTTELAMLSVIGDFSFFFFNTLSLFFRFTAIFFLAKKRPQQLQRAKVPRRFKNELSTDSTTSSSLHFAVKY